MNSTKSLKFNKHTELEGLHAFLGASKYHWINYSNDKLIETYRKEQAKQYGTRLHALASEHIQLGIKMPARQDTLCMFVNDAIGYKMQSEQVLFYSYNCFGTADAISFKKNKLRIHDLKTGEVPAHKEQLYIYAALFCLEYDIRPGDISMELRLYQNNDVIIFEPTAEDIVPIMDKIKAFDRLINNSKEED